MKRSNIFYILIGLVLLQCTLHSQPIDEISDRVSHAKRLATASGARIGPNARLIKQLLNDCDNETERVLIKTALLEMYATDTPHYHNDLWEVSESLLKEAIPTRLRARILVLQAGCLAAFYEKEAELKERAIQKFLESYLVLRRAIVEETQHFEECDSKIIELDTRFKDSAQERWREFSRLKDEQRKIVLHLKSMEFQRRDTLREVKRLAPDVEYLTSVCSRLETSASETADEFAREIDIIR